MQVFSDARNTISHKLPLLPSYLCSVCMCHVQLRVSKKPSPLPHPSACIGKMEKIWDGNACLRSQLFPLLLISPRKEKALWISPTAVLVVTQGIETGWEKKRLKKFMRTNSYGNASVMKHPVGQLLGQGKADKRYREAHGGKREMLAFTARERKGKKGGGRRKWGESFSFQVGR